MICPPDGRDGLGRRRKALRVAETGHRRQGDPPRVEATLAEAEPEIDPNRADEITETFAAPPFRRPAAAVGDIS